MHVSVRLCACVHVCECVSHSCSLDYKIKDYIHIIIAIATRFNSYDCSFGVEKLLHLESYPLGR